MNEYLLPSFKGNPVDNLEEFFSYNIPVLLVAGGVDEVVSLEKNGRLIIDYCKANGIDLEYYVKPDCGHHPHSLENVTPIVKFCK